MNELLKFLKQIKTTRQQASVHQNFTYRYFNFWKINDPNKVWFSKFVEYRELNPNQKPINFISVFGSPYTYILLKSPKVFFTGEDLQSSTFPNLKRFKNNLIGKVDLSLGFENIKHKNYFRLPLWVISFFDPDSDLESIRKKISTINDASYRQSGRNLFVSQISRHDANGIRAEMINLLKDLGRIDCAGNFMNNTSDLQTKFNDNKIEFLKNYKFNICPENSDNVGYVTEKLIDAFKAGCIPIYWSEKNIPNSEIINKEAILFYDEKNPQLLQKKVEELWTNEKAYAEFIKIPPFKPDAAEKIWEIFSQLSYKFKEVIDKY